MSHRKSVRYHAQSPSKLPGSIAATSAKELLPQSLDSQLESFPCDEVDWHGADGENAVTAGLLAGRVSATPMSGGN
jgi:hypothetical protein